MVTGHVFQFDQRQRSLLQFSPICCSGEKRGKTLATTRPQNTSKPKVDYSLSSSTVNKMKFAHAHKNAAAAATQTIYRWKGLSSWCNKHGIKKENASERHRLATVTKRIESSSENWMSSAVTEFDRHFSGVREIEDAVKFSSNFCICQASRIIFLVR